MNKTKIVVEKYHRFIIYPQYINLEDFLKIVESRCNFQVDSFFITTITNEKIEIKKETDWEIARASYIEKIIPIKKTIKDMSFFMKDIDFKKIESFKKDLTSSTIKETKKETPLEKIVTETTKSEIKKEEVKMNDEEFKENINLLLQLVLQHDLVFQNQNQIDFSLYGLYQVIDQEKNLNRSEYLHWKLIKCPGVEGFLKFIGYERENYQLKLKKKIYMKDYILGEIKKNMFSEMSLKIDPKKEKYSDEEKKMIEEIYKEYKSKFTNEYDIETIINIIDQKISSLPQVKYKILLEKEKDNLINLEKVF